MLKHIQLFKGSKSWLSGHYIENMRGDLLPCPDKINLFGTHYTPLPFTLAAQAQDVLKEIQKINPASLVYLQLEKPIHRFDIKPEQTKTEQQPKQLNLFERN